MKTFLTATSSICLYILTSNAVYSNTIQDLRNYSLNMSNAERQYIQNNQNFYQVRTSTFGRPISESRYAFLLDKLVRPGISRHMDELFGDNSLVSHVQQDPTQFRAEFTPINISGDGTEELAVFATITKPDGSYEVVSYILKQESGTWNVVFATWGLTARNNILFLDTPSGEFEHIVFQSSIGRFGGIATYVPELKFFMTEEDRNAFIERVSSEVVATEAKAMVSDQVVWVMDSVEHTLSTYSRVRQDATSLFQGSRPEYEFGEVNSLLNLTGSEYRYASDVLYSQSAFLGGLSLEPLRFSEVVLPLAGFNDFGENDAIMPMRGRSLTYEINPEPTNPTEMINFASGKAHGTIKVTEQTPIRFGYSFESTALCSISFSINGKEVIPHLDEKTRQFEETLVRTFPVGEFPYELDMTCDINPDSYVGSERFTKVDIILQTEHEVSLPTYSYDWTNVISERSDGMPSIEPVAVEVETNRDGERSSQLELIDFSQPVVLRDFSDEQNSRIIPQGYTEKVIHFEFTPEEVGVYEFAVRSLSNVCASTSGNACLIQYGRSTGRFVGYQLLHPASSIQVGEKRSVSAGTFPVQRIGYESTFTHRPTLNHVLPVRVTEEMLGQTISVEIVLNVDMTKALVSNNNVQIADVFGELDERNHHSVAGQYSTPTIVQDEVDMLRDGIVPRMEFTLAIRTPSETALRPLTVNDVSSHQDNRRNAVPVVYERNQVGSVSDDTSWID